METIYRRIRDVVRHQRLLLMPPDASVRAAAKAMREYHVGSVMVVENGALVGLFTERDALFRVIADGLDPDGTELAAVMTRRLITVSPDQLLVNAMHLMHDYGVRHMPVVENGRPVGMVSVRDALGSEVVRFEHEMEFKEQLAATMR